MDAAAEDRLMVPVEALGVTVGIQVPSRVGGAVRRAWSRALVEAMPEVVVEASGPERTALHQLSMAVTAAAIERQSGRLWMLHAAGLADPVSGATVALVAPSGTGKSTASRTLARDFAYVSDETVGVTSDGRVLAYPKPLSVIDADDGLKAQLSPDELGLARPPRELRLAAVVVLRRDGAEPALEPVRTAAALPMLTEQTSYLDRLERPLRTVAGILEGTRGVFELHYAEAATLAPLLRTLLEATR